MLLLKCSADQVQDAVFELLRWTEGSFAFDAVDAGDITPGIADVALVAAELVSEGQRRMQTWPDLVAGLPAPATVLALNTAATKTSPSHL